MAEINIPQNEADALIAMEKHRTDDKPWEYPPLGGQIQIPLISNDKREHFFLDISRGKIDLSKGKYQNRARQVVLLVRLDFGGSPHRNPDNQEIPCPHLHVYREGFGLRWAIPVPKDKFPIITDLRQTLEDFMRYCNITQPPMIQGSLF